MEKVSARTGAHNRLDRWVCAGVGLLFMVLALAIAISSDGSAGGWVYAAAAVIGALGVEALVAAVRNRRSLLSRIGPLP
jgi:hypothetical protein